MEENAKPPINEDYIMSIVSDAQSGQSKVQTPDNEQLRRLKPKSVVQEKTLTDEQAPETNIEEKTSEDRQENRETRKRKNSRAPKDYESQFIKKADLTVRSGKGVYIRNDYHNSINRIISVIASNEISITDYLDNVLTHHFESFEQEITDVFDKKYKPIVKTDK